MTVQIRGLSVPMSLLLGQCQFSAHLSVNIHTLTPTPGVTLSDVTLADLSLATHADPLSVILADL